MANSKYSAEFGRGWISVIDRAIATSLVVLALVATPAFAGSIDGRVLDKDQVGLDKVKVCMADASAPQTCVKQSQTDRFGYYSFNGVKPGNYVVGVDRERTASGRRTEAFKTFVWTKAMPVSLASNKDRRELSDIVGKFNFSNFQRSLELRAADFPELTGFDPYAEPVFIKVYHAAVAAGGEPETVFIGRVGNTARMSIEASIPLATTELAYDIYSASASASGVIAVSN